MVRRTVGVAGVSHPNLDTLPTQVICVLCKSQCRQLLLSNKHSPLVLSNCDASSILIYQIIYVNLCFKEFKQAPDPLNLLNTLNDFGDDTDSQLGVYFAH